MRSVSQRAGGGGAGARGSFPWGVSPSGLQTEQARPREGCCRARPTQAGGRDSTGRLVGRGGLGPNSATSSSFQARWAQRGRAACGHISPYQLSPPSPAGSWGEPGSPLGVSVPGHVGRQRPLVTPKRSPSLLPCLSHVLWIRQYIRQQQVNK